MHKFSTPRVGRLYQADKIWRFFKATQESVHIKKGVSETSDTLLILSQKPILKLVFVNIFNAQSNSVFLRGELLDKNFNAVPYFELVERINVFFAFGVNVTKHYEKLYIYNNNGKIYFYTFCNSILTEHDGDFYE